jgi:hypothetical protein
MRRLQRGPMGVRDGKRKPYDLHERHIQHIVANAGAFSRRYPQPQAQLLERSELVPYSLQDMLNAKLATAERDHLRAPSRDDPDAHAGLVQLLDALAIADVKGLERFPARAEIQPPVGHHPIHVQDQ